MSGRSLHTAFIFLMLLLPGQQLRAQHIGKDVPFGRAVWTELNRDAESKRTFKASLFLSNPILLQTDSSGQYTILVAQLDHEDKQLYDPQAGSGLQSYSLLSRGFRRIGEHKSVWGKAYYKKGADHNVLWNETADLDRVYPYVTADSVGGDMQRETYYLEGGYNQRIGKQVWGISAAYRAATHHREQDPRPHNIVSDLIIRAGSSRNWRQHVVGVSYDFGYYTQSSTIRIANPNIGPSFFHLIGMGMDQKLLWGRHTDTYYKGTSHRVAMQLLPVATAGWYADLAVQKQFIDKSVTTLQPLLTSYADTWQAAGKLGYRIEGVEYAWEPMLSYTWYERKGTSFLFNNSGSNSYTKVGEVQDFRHQDELSAFSIAYYRTISDHLTARLTPSIAYRQEESRYRDEERMWQVDNIQWGVNAGLWGKINQRQAWQATFGLTKAHVMKEVYSMQFPVESEGLNELTRQQFILRGTPHLEVYGQAQYRRSITRQYAGIVGLSGRLQSYQNNKTNTAISASVGLAF